VEIVNALKNRAIEPQAVVQQSVTMFPVGTGNPATGAFDEAMYAPATPLSVAANATHAASSAGAGPVTGVGTGETHHALRDD